MKPHKLASLVLAGTLGLSACVDEPTAPQRPAPEPSFSASAAASTGQHLVVFRGNGIPSDFSDRVAALGGEVAYALPQVGAAYVAGLDAPGLASLRKVSGVSTVEPEGVLQLVRPAAQTRLAGTEPQSPTDPAGSIWFGLQWNMRTIGADQAWAAGELGASSVTVAIVDTGLDYTHYDLSGRVDLSRSRSFLPDEDAVIAEHLPGLNPVFDLHGHGTHVGATVASNGVVAAGVTSRTTLIGLKVCRSGIPGLTSSGCPNSATFAALLHAADSGADVVNMSLGGLFTKRDNPGYASVINRVFSYLKQKNVTVVVAAGNDNTDLDHHLYPEVDEDGYETGEITHYPSLYATYCDSPHVLCVSATGPSSATNVIYGPWNDIDARSVYSNFGRSAVGVAAPGGNVGGYVWAACPRFAVVGNATSGFQGVVDPYCNGGYPAGMAGTSMASPHVAGLAALMVEKHGKNPSKVLTAIRKSADDLGQSGTDPFYGKGRINVARAVGAS